MMNAKESSRFVSQDPSAGAIPEIETAGIIVVCVLLVAACFAALLLAQLPQSLDAAASSERILREISASAASESSTRESHSAHPAADGADTLDENALAMWRMRESD